MTYGNLPFCSSKNVSKDYFCCLLRYNKPSLEFLRPENLSLRKIFLYESCKRFIYCFCKECFFEQATAVFEQGQQEEAITLLRDSLKLLPNSSAIVKVLASFLMNRKRPKEVCTFGSCLTRSSFERINSEVNL